MLLTAGIIICAAALLFLFLVFPSPIKPADYKRLARHSYAHRGLHDNRSGPPENTLEAFGLAAERGYGIELDLQLTADKQLVVFHDLDLKRASGMDRRIRDMDYEELKQIKVFGSGHAIPLFSECLSLIGGRIPLIAEIKSDRDGAWSSELCRIADEQLRAYSGIYCVESFDPFVIRWFMKNSPKTVRGQLSMGVKCLRAELTGLNAFILSNLMTNFLCRPNFIAYRSADIGFGVYVQKLLGAMSVMWTVKNEDEHLSLTKTEDAIIFEGYAPSPRWEA